MKKVLKVTPLALGLLTLASCSSDDFLGSADVNGRLELNATVEAPYAEDGTRAAFNFTPTKVLWQNGDQFRVYDEMLQKYDIFKCDGSAIALDGKQLVEAHKKVIFPAENVYYAGYDRENELVTAVMTVPTLTTYGGADVEGDVVAYVSNLPMWGDVKTESTTSLAVELRQMAAYTDITIYKDFINDDNNVKAIRVLALQAGKTAPKTAVKETYLDKETPLSGYFEAQLADDRTLVANLSNPVVEGSYKSYIQVDGVNESKALESHVYIPIIPATYKNLVIQVTYDGTNWTYVDGLGKVGVYKETTIGRNIRIANGLVIGNKPKEARVSTLEELNTMLDKAVKDGALNDGDVLNVVATDGDLNVEKDQESLKLPAINMVINLNSKILNEVGTRHFEISGGAANKKVTLNVMGGISGGKDIEINTSSALTLGGELKNTDESADTKPVIKVIKVGTPGLSLGEGIFVPFSTNMDVEISTGTVTVDAGNGSVKNIGLKSATLTSVINVVSGKVEGIGVSEDDASIVPANGAVNVTGGYVKTLKTNTGIITIENATVDEIETSATKQNTTPGVLVKKAVVNKLTNNAAKPVITVEGGVTVEGTDEVALAKISELNLAANNTATVNSTGKAAILTVKNSATATFTSTWNDKNIAVDNTLIGSTGEIYTAAQLAGLGTGTQKGKYKLMANVTINSDADWTPVNNSKSFDGNAKSITGLNAPLFGILKGGTIGGAAVTNKLTLKDVTIDTTDGNQGALAKEINGSVTIQNVEVNGTSTIGAATGGKEESVNIGGLVGKATGTVKLIDNKVTATVNGYANVGGYIGNYAGTNITMSVSHKSNFVSTVEFNANKLTSVAAGTTSNPLAGTFGYFIGSLTTTSKTGVTVKIEKTAEGVGDKFAHYFVENKIKPATLKFDNNKLYEDGTFLGYFNGMKDHEIGYSTALAAEFTKYNTVDVFNMPIIYTIDDINVFGATKLADPVTE